MMDYRKVTYLIPHLFMLLVIAMEVIYNATLSLSCASPYLELAVVFYCCMYMPNLFPFLFLFLLGLARDLLLFDSLGLSSLSFVLIKVLSNYQRLKRVDRSFSNSWIMFAVNAGAVLLCTLILLMIKSDSSYGLFVCILKRWVYTSVAYAPIHLALRYMQTRWIARKANE
jgi:cell shape-determining protein MreD